MLRAYGRAPGPDTTRILRTEWHRIYYRRGLPTNRCAVCSRKSRDCASAGRYCGRMSPMGRDIPESRSPCRRMPGRLVTGPTRSGEISRAAQSRAAFTAAIVVIIVGTTVAARMTAVVIFILVPRWAGGPTRLRSARPALRGPLRSRTAAVLLQTW